MDLRARLNRNPCWIFTSEKEFEIKVVEKYKTYILQILIIFLSVVFSALWLGKRLVDQRILVRFSVRGRHYSLRRCEANHSALFSAEVIQWSHTFIPHLSSWCRAKLSTETIFKSADNNRENTPKRYNVYTFSNLKLMVFSIVT
jgi:hypothetical protein